MPISSMPFTQFPVMRIYTTAGASARKTVRGMGEKREEKVGGEGEGEWEDRRRKRTQNCDLLDLSTTLAIWRKSVMSAASP